MTAPVDAGRPATPHFDAWLHRFAAYASDPMAWNREYRAPQLDAPGLVERIAALEDWALWAWIEGEDAAAADLMRDAAALARQRDRVPSWRTTRTERVHGS